MRRKERSLTLEDAIQEAVYVGAMPDEVTIAGSTAHLCSICLGACYLSPAGEAFWEQAHVRIVCRRCAPIDAQRRQGVRSAVLPGTLVELRERGMSDRDLKACMRHADRYLQGKVRWPGDGR